MNDTPNSGILRLTFDVVIASILFLVACVFAGVVNDLIGTEQRWVYLALFMIGMLPFLLYARHRGVAEFDRWDVLAYSPVPVIVAAALSCTNDLLPIVLATLALTCFASGLRRILPHQNSAAS